MSQAPESVWNGPQRNPESGRSSVGDIVWGVVLTLLEATLYVAGMFFIGIGQWGNPQVEVYRAQATHWTTGLILVALSVAALASWRGARWTAGLQALAALVLAVLLGLTYHFNEVKQPHPAPPYTGPVCYSGSNTCP